MKRKALKILEYSVFFTLTCLLLFAGALLGYEKVYAGKILRNVYVENVDLSGKNIDQAKYLTQKMFDNVLNQKITLKSDSHEINAKLADTGLDVDINKVVDNAYKIGRDQNFFLQLFNSAKTVAAKNEVKLTPKIDSLKYQSFLNIAVAQLNVDPQNASLAIENGEIKEVSEVQGQTIKTDGLAEEIIAAASNKKGGVLKVKTVVKPSEVKATDFQQAKAYATNILNKQISFTYQDQTFTPTKKEIGLWVAFTNNNGTIAASLDDNNIKTYLNNIGKNFEVPEKDRKINSLTNEVIEEGQQGMLLDKNDAITKLKSALQSNSAANIPLTTYTVDIKEIKVIPAEGLVPGRFDGKYIDVDLTAQKLCRIESSNIIDCFQISSGKPGMPTPTGTFTIMEKNPRHWSSEFQMWLPWWERLTSSGVGLHELPEVGNWKETDVHLGTPVSHGCVRLGVGPAETVFNWTDIGTPVYVHK